MSARSGILATMVSVAFGAILVAAGSSQGYSWLLRSDAQHFYLVATDPFGNGDVFEGAPPGVGTAYRYGRVFYPLLAWALALGQRSWVVYTLPVVYLLGVWLLAALACELCMQAGKSPERGLFVFLVPAVLITLPLLVPEMLIVGLCLLTYRFVAMKRPVAAWMTAALMLLARETMVLALAPFILREGAHRRYGAALIWCATAIPLALWWTWVRVRIGFWPFLDPTVAYSQPFDMPIRGFLGALWSPASDTALLLAASAGWLTLGLAIYAHLAVPRFPLTAGAIVSALLIVFFGPGQANLPGEAFRVMMPAQVLVALALLSGRSR